MQRLGIAGVILIPSSNGPGIFMCQPSRLTSGSNDIHDVAQVTLDAPVPISEKVEEWLEHLKTAMKGTLTSTLQECLRGQIDYERYPSQVSHAHSHSVIPAKQSTLRHERMSLQSAATSVHCSMQSIDRLSLHFKIATDIEPPNM